MELKYNKRIIYVLAFFILSCYLRILPASIYAGDPGELITAGYTLGISHPPGYPLYVLINKIFTTIFPVGNIAFRSNILTMLFALGGFILLYITLENFFKSTTAAIISVLLLAFSPTILMQSIIGEVYSLNFLFLSILIYLELNEPDNILIYYIYGLSLTIHHTMLLLAPFFIYKAWKEKRLSDYKIYLVFIIGLSAYLYVYIRGHQIPLLNWGETSNLKNFFKHITRAEYGTIFKNPFSILTSLKQIIKYIISLSAQFTPIFVLLGIMGIYFLPEKRNFLLSAFIITGVFVILLLNISLKPRELYDIEVFYIPSYVIFSLFIANGIKYILDYNYSKSFIKKGILTLLIIVTFYQVGYSLYKNNNAYNTITYNYGLNNLNTLRRDSVIFVSRDNIASSLSYLMLVENRRHDAIFYNPAFQIIRNNYPSTIKENQKYIKNKINWYKIPVYQSEENELLKNEGLLYTNYDQPYFKIVNYYNLYRVNHPSSEYKDYEIRSIILEELFSEVRYLELLEKKFAVERVMEEVKKYTFDNLYGHQKLAHYYELNKKNFKAIKEYKSALAIDPNNADFHNNIGFIYYNIGNYLLSADYHQKALKLNPKTPNSYYGLAQIEEKNNNFEKAKTYWIKYLELEKKNDIWILEAQKHVGHIGKGIIK